MVHHDFQIVLADLLDHCSVTLLRKREEYADDYDVLQNFKRAGSLQQVEPSEALMGMLAKHTISLYDMVSKGDPTKFTEAQWDEKLVDHMNYLILLKALIRESLDNPKD